MKRRIREHLSSPLLRNGYALVVNTFSTAGLGAVFWIVAARMYSPEDVGISAALLSAMVFLAKLAQVNLVNALNRFLPAAGADSRRFVGGSYAVAGSFAAVAAVCFVAGVGVWAPELDVVRDGAWQIVGFTLATVAWAIFVLQDAALTGIRRSTWIPIENALYGLAKIGLLVGFAVAVPSIGIFAASVLPLVFVLAPVNWLMFRRAIPQHIASTNDSAAGFEPGVVARYAAADFVASLGWVVAIDLLPVIVLTMAGAEASAFFFLAWTIAYTLFLISKNTGMSLITEAALEPTRLASLSRRVLVQTLGIVVPLGTGLAVFAPLVLGVFGPEYGDGATPVLRLLIAASVPTVIVSLQASIYRVQRRMLALTVLYGLLGFGVVGLGVALLPSAGIVGVGWAWVTVSTVLAATLLCTEMRPIWLPHVLASPAVDRLIGLVKRGGGSDGDPLGDHAGALRAALGPFESVEKLPTDLDLTAMSVRTGAQRVMLKVAHSRTASVSLRLEADALETIHGDRRLGDFTDFVPRLVATGGVDERVFLLQEHKRGVDGRRTSELGLDPAVAMRHTAAVVSRLHRATATRRVLDDADVRRIVDDPLDLVLGSGSARFAKRHADAAARMKARMRAEIIGRPAAPAWIHGDCWLGNVIVDDEAAPSGIVDWGGVDYDGLPGIDIVHLILTTRMLTTGRDLGTVVLGALESPDLSDDERHALDLVDTELPWGTLVLLTWLHHVTMNLRKSDRYRSSWLWSARTIDRVLGAM